MSQKFPRGYASSTGARPRGSRTGSRIPDRAAKTLGGGRRPGRRKEPEPHLPPQGKPRRRVKRARVARTQSPPPARGGGERHPLFPVQRHHRPQREGPGRGGSTDPTGGPEEGLGEGQDQGEPRAARRPGASGSARRGRTVPAPPPGKRALKVSSSSPQGDGPGQQQGEDGRVLCVGGERRDPHAPPVASPPLQGGCWPGRDSRRLSPPV